MNVLKQFRDDFGFSLFYYALWLAKSKRKTNHDLFASFSHTWRWLHVFALSYDDLLDSLFGKKV